MEANDEYLTISQSAAYCGVNRGTIQRWVSERQLTRRRVGREALVPKAQLDILKQVHTLEDVVKEAARSADIPLHLGEETLVRMNSYLMARHGKDVLELYDPVNTRACVVRVKLEKLS